MRQEKGRQKEKKSEEEKKRQMEQEKDRMSHVRVIVFSSLPSLLPFVESRPAFQLSVCECVCVSTPVPKVLNHKERY